MVISPMYVDPDNSEGIPASAAAPRRRFDAAALSEQLAEASPHDIVEAAVRAMPDRLAVVSSFGTESAVLLKFVAEVDPSLPVFGAETAQKLNKRDEAIAEYSALLKLDASEDQIKAARKALAHLQ